jgi:hypothetical protein
MGGIEIFYPPGLLRSPVRELRSPWLVVGGWWLVVLFFLDERSPCGWI